MRHDTPINNIPALIQQWNQLNRISARYYDQHGFPVWGIVLDINEKESKITIDHKANCVNMSALIETKQI